MWRSLVARFVRDEEVVGSNPATPTVTKCLPAGNSRRAGISRQMLALSDQEFPVSLSLTESTPSLILSPASEIFCLTEAEP